MYLCAYWSSCVSQNGFEHVPVRLIHKTQAEYISVRKSFLCKMLHLMQRFSLCKNGIMDRFFHEL